VLAFGAAALAPLDQEAADAAVEDALGRGVNHFDVAPTYGGAEGRLAPSVKRHREHLFLACKTRQRKRFRARDELHRSLETLGTDSFDLYQCHAVASSLDLEQLLGPRGALELFQEARDEGLVRFLGITGHHCDVLRQALESFPFDTVMLPVNPIQAADPRPATDYRPVLEVAQRRGVGVIAIKAVARGPWPAGVRRTYTTWYRPYDDEEEVGRRLRFALSHPIATCVLPSDVHLWPQLFEVAGDFEPLPDAEMSGLVDASRGAEPLYVESMLPARQAYGPRS
jgi:aryl-alcohol dehydrogenase-like predicted oxidoreductase